MIWMVMWDPSSEKCDVVCFEVEVEETTDSNGVYGKLYDGLS